MNKKLKDEYTSLLEKLTINLIAQCDWYRTSDQKTIERTGVVYVINQVGTDNYKIGVSSNYTERLNHFGVKLPFDIKEVAVYETEDYFSKEKALHEMFSDKRLNGSEFFELTEEDLKEIDSFMTAPEEDIVSTEESLTDDVLFEEEQGE